MLSWLARLLSHDWSDSLHMFIELISVILPQCRQIFFGRGGIRFVMPIIHSPDSSYRDVLLNSLLLSPSLSSSPHSCIFIMHYVDPSGICFEIVPSFETGSFMVNWQKIIGLPCMKWWCRKQASCLLCPWLLTHPSLLHVHIHFQLSVIRWNVWSEESYVFQTPVDAFIYQIFFDEFALICLCRGCNILIRHSNQIIIFNKRFMHDSRFFKFISALCAWLLALKGLVKICSLLSGNQYFVCGRFWCKIKVLFGILSPPTMNF